ncbi:hypothetical protein PsorP6_018114 [Peronosclerospora sorghi]|uniref:Uncharacterized protein n=1 Tax=Peronosclerospora sorghi TaxID=230839 RepID=A0ACC0WFM2_9STRA|nr:hypothetical protein PsorP6_018114 [Peronosclerospora sorghi]
MKAPDYAGAPPCDICRHNHEQLITKVEWVSIVVQGVKCFICGHTGKSRAYNCFKIAFTAFKFTVLHFDYHEPDAVVTGAVTALHPTNLTLWTFIPLLRQRIFPTMASIMSDDPVSRHFVAFVGDGPIGLARWRCAHEESGRQVALIEYLGIVEKKWRQGYGRRLLDAVVENIHASYAHELVHPRAVVASVPRNDSFFAAMKLFQSIGFEPSRQTEVVNTSSFQQMQMEWDCGNR